MIELFLIHFVNISRFHCCVVSYQGCFNKIVIGLLVLLSDDSKLSSIEEKNNEFDG